MNRSVLATVFVLAAIRPVAAETAEPAATGLSARSPHVDLEVDPTAFALSGYSGHLGLGLGRFRLDLGAYAMALPELVHGNADYDARFDGFGAKFQYFAFAAAGEQKGLFVGVDAGALRMHATHRETEMTDTQLTFGVGVHAGYRFALPAGFYATPWIGVGYSFGGHDVTMNGATFHSSPFSVFPAVHLGYRFK